MRKVKLIVRETYQGKRKSEDVFAAVCLIELMPHTKAHLSKAKSIIAERMSDPATITLAGWNWWLSQPWASETNCIDWKE